MRSGIRERRLRGPSMSWASLRSSSGGFRRLFLFLHGSLYFCLHSVSLFVLYLFNDLGNLGYRYLIAAMKQTLDIFRNNIDLEVQLIAWLELRKVGHLPSLRNDGNLEVIVHEPSYSEADSLHGN